MAVGSFALVLHSHLPYYRKAGKWPFGEENLHEAIAETYIPLLDAIHALKAEGIDAKITVGITPVLAEQLADEYLKEGFEEYLEEVLDRIELDRETYEDLPEDPRHELADYYHDWYTQKLDAFQKVYHRDLLGAFKALQDEGAIEIITSAATHGFSPLLGRDSSLNAQFKVGVETYEKHFGQKPKGVWLPECAYRPAREAERRPAIDQFLYENGLEFFFTDFHAVEGGQTAGYRRQIGPYGTIDYVPMPLRPESGLDTFSGYWLPDNPVAVFARNRKAGEQVWEADQGYPGDPWYREFHKRDSQSGMQYWRITGRTWDMEHKEYYDPAKALERIDENSTHYVGLIHDLLQGYQDQHGHEGSLVVPFDTELFGHWWYEGVEWIKAVIRKMAANDEIRRVTVSELMEIQPPSIAIDLPESTWGAGGHYKVWMNPQVEFMWPIIHRCEQRMEELVRRFPDPVSELQGRALAQAARELLLLEGSDWPFLVTTGQAKAWAIERFNLHVERFETLADMLVANALDEETLEEIEEEDNLFEGIDYRVFKNRQSPLSATSPAEPK
ncbi:1,4-alpha-glucan branching enzyme [compost metagenome]